MRILDILTKPNILNEENSDVSDKEATEFEDEARKARNAGDIITINYKYPSIEIELSNGQEYFLQGEEADDLLSEVPGNVNATDFILVIAQSW